MHDLTGADVTGSTCVFCQIIEGAAPATLVRSWWNGIAIVPLNPVVDGHVLVIPRNHVADALEDPATTAVMFGYAAEIAEGPCNLITSVGEEATQSVFHLHVHVVPRRAGDGLHLPWTDQQRLPLEQCDPASNRHVTPHRGCILR